MTYINLIHLYLSSDFMEIIYETVIYLRLFVAIQNQALPGISLCLQGNKLSILSEHQSRINCWIPELSSFRGHNMAAHQGSAAQQNEAVRKAEDGGELCFLKAGISYGSYFFCEREEQHSTYSVFTKEVIMLLSWKVFGINSHS